ncbi:hypothetical protein MTO96_010065 [Rhipicephalus appendiculatus]
MKSKCGDRFVHLQDSNCIGHRRCALMTVDDSVVERQTLAKCPRRPHREHVRLLAGQAAEFAQCCVEPQR